MTIHGRHKQKDACDIYYCIRNYPGGPTALAGACKPLLKVNDDAAGFGCIAEKFETVDGYGPTCVSKFVEENHFLGERTAEPWQQDAFGQVARGSRLLGCGPETDV